MLNTTVEQKIRVRDKQRKDRNYRYNHSPKGIARQKAWQKAIRDEVFSHYGDRCVCCGETQWQFLCLDHIHNGRGNPAVRHGSGTAFYSWVKRNNYPQDLQVLCHNCNMAKGLYGKCPHCTL